MLDAHRYIAVDLGATSGRVVVGTVSDVHIGTEELHRFPTRMVEKEGHLHWDINAMFNSILDGLKVYRERFQEDPTSIGVDTWGVDVCLFKEDGGPARMPYAYRTFSDGTAMDSFLNIIPAERLHDITGIQLLPFNTVFQLHWMKQNGILDDVARVMMLPDALSYFLTGTGVTEMTIASTSQLLDRELGSWSREIFDGLGVETSIFPGMVYPGTVVDTLRPELQDRLGLGPVPVIAVGGHDTASAVAAVPAGRSVAITGSPEAEARGGTGSWAYISSGTWSLMGAELGTHRVSPETRSANFTNEGGVENTVRFLKNLTGLWLLEQCKREWDESDGRTIPYDELLGLAGSSLHQGVIDVNHPRFLNPTSMVDEITDALADTCPSPEEEKGRGQRGKKRCPEFGSSVRGDLVRIILRSLAASYRTTLDTLESLLEARFDTIHLIGGGSRNDLLSQMTAETCGRRVVAGPAEATSLGNLIMQAVASDVLPDVATGRALIESSIPLKTFHP